MLKLNKHIFFLLLIFSVASFAQKEELTFEQAYLFGIPKLIKSLPTIETCVDDNFYFVKEGEKIKRVNVLTKEERLLFDYDEIKSELPSGFGSLGLGVHTKNYSKFLFEKNNDIYLYNRKNKKLTQLTSDESIEKNLMFSPDENLIAYTKNNNLFVNNNGLEIQLTFDGSDVILNGYASWVYYEEILGRASHYRAFYWSPDSKQISFLQFDDTNVPTFTLFNADGVHGELVVRHYPKPGDANPDVKLGVVSIETQKITWIDSTINKGNYIAWSRFTNDSKGLLYQKMNRGQDTLDIMFTQVADVNPKQIYEETQKTWVEFLEDFYMLKSRDEFLIRSEVDGWHHIYHYNLNGKLLNKITTGAWAVKDIAYVNEETDEIFFHASKEKSTEKHLYKTSFDGKEITKLTKEAGTHSCTVLARGKWFFDKWSSITNPTKLVLNNVLSGESELIADSKSPELDKYKIGKVELFTIPTEDGYRLPAKWFLPPDFDKSKKYPIIFSVYGGPGIATVTNSFPRRGLGNYYLAENGIIVIQVDNRGSGHFGKKGKDKMHRNLGVWEIDDLISAVKWLRDKPFIDSNKIAITGGSYGGYTTSMALARAGEYFKFGIAKYAVTDWQLYDNIYTERFMDTPKENPDGYEYASVMTHVDSYNGGMLITHGSLDDNVHMQNTMQLIDKLQNLDKEFELMIYPNQRHGIRYPKYSHSMRLDINFWFKNLLKK